MLTVPNQPDYELSAVKEHEFIFKDLKGYKAVFEMNGEEEEASKLILNQPNGLFTAERKE